MVVIKILIPELIKREYKPIPLIKLRRNKKIVLNKTPIKLSYIISFDRLLACKNAARGASM